MRKPKPTDLERQLIRLAREAQKADPALTDYALAKRAGCQQITLSRFFSGQRSLTLKSADKLCKALGLGFSKNNPKIA